MVTAALVGATRVASIVANTITALEAIQSARKDVEKLRKAGMPKQAAALERDCDRAERRVRKAIASDVRRRAKARTRSRGQSRTSGGKFG